MADEIENQTVIMSLIINGGNAKGSAFQAIHAAKDGHFTTADQKLKEADSYLSEAHNAQTDMLTKEANGDHAKMSLLMVHAQDHVMTAITFRDLAGEIVDLYKQINQSRS
ncbi:PTS cellobiose transporter subunit IIA [Oenococcus oeni]|uniref:PTS lactose/cellobiose transporter subunit IIA n=1 Tax=Oenococcus oeni TaxID=1247 RepID=UPI00050E9DB3|nr:PTS lactose/cellobiose transporter subunit IIA [Oenococcus oeni]KGH65293.1 PTS cellobiose transporter subunit IIA [Oenococcus oeni IOEB_C23]KGH73206.1 PTS cellobiose transporter subunit IIA [Oenococcus oeni IOEB_0502]PDH94074.1 PTS cellobiose transporter subunit IIA [Oenococcus oeni]